MLTTVQQFKELYDIDLDILPIIEIAPHGREIVEPDWRTAINSFCRSGHEQSVKKKIGLDLVTRIIGEIKPTEVDSQFISSLSEDYKDEIFDKALRQFSPTQLAMGIPDLKPVDIIAREVLFDYEYGCRDVWISEAELKEQLNEAAATRKPSEDRHLPGETVPMMGRNVLVFANGRKDGVTEALCECFCELGACVVLTYVCDDRQKDGAVNAEKIAQNCRNMPGSIKIVEGIPYRSKHQAPQPPNVRFVEELIDQAVQKFDSPRRSRVIDCVGK